LQPDKYDTKKIKLLILSPSLECGGSEKYVSLLCNTINRQQFSVTLAVLNNENPFYTITNKDEVLIDLKVKHARSSLFKIKSLVKQHQPDIIFSTANHLNIYLAVFRQLFSKKIIFIARESSVVSINSKSAKFPVLYNLLIKTFYKGIDFIICQSKYMQQDLIDNYNIKKEKTIIINNAVEENLLLLAATQKNKFITVARLSEEKGIDRLIRSVANLDTPFIYYIIGDGDKKGSLQNLINQLQLQSKVFLTGKKDTPFAGMEDAALFLMGSHYEGFPNTLLEAGALGIPVIAFNAPGGINEIINDGENGLLVKDGDEKAFAAAIEKALNIDFNRQQIKNNTQRMFSLNLAIKKTEALFLELRQNLNLLK
jgi:glycosyltransferase involved in cell wall biosynthesis